MAKLVNAADLKSAGETFAGSSPARRTIWIGGMANIDLATWGALQPTAGMNNEDFKRMYKRVWGKLRADMGHSPSVERVRKVYSDSDNETPLPTRFKVRSRALISDYEVSGVAVDFRNYILTTLARDITDTVAATMDVTEFRDEYRKQTECTGSVYVFNEQQLKDFIREVEDAVKENLAT